MINVVLFGVIFIQKNGKIRVGLLCYIGGYCVGIFLRILLTWLEVEISAINWCVIFVTNFGSLAACAVFASSLRADAEDRE